jgi:hypothetical protein
MTAKYLANPTSLAHSTASKLPNFWAHKLSLQANGKPISRIERASLLSSKSSNFLVTDKTHLAREALRMLSVTFIVKSISTLSILGKALNHTPARMAFNLILTSCVLSRKLKLL